MYLDKFYNASEDELIEALNQSKEENGESSIGMIDKFVREKYRDYNKILSLYDDCGCGQGKYEDYTYYKTQVEQVLTNLLKFIKCASKVGVPVKDLFEELVEQEISFEENLNRDFKKLPILSGKVYDRFKDIALELKSVNAFYTLFFMTGDLEYLNNCIEECNYEQLIALYEKFKDSESEHEIFINDKWIKVSNVLTLSNCPLYVLDGKNFSDIYESLIKHMAQMTGHNEIDKYYNNFNNNFSIFDVLKQAWEIGYFKNADDFIRYAIDREYYSLIFAEEMKDEELWLDFASDEILLELLGIINLEKEKYLKRRDYGRLSYLIDQEIQVFLGFKNTNFKGIDNILSRFSTKEHLKSWLPVAKKLLDCESVNVDSFKNWVQVFFKNEKMFKCDKFAGSKEFQDFIDNLPQPFNKEKQALEMWRYGRYYIPAQFDLKKSKLLGNSEWSFFVKTGYFKRKINVLGSDWSKASKYLVDNLENQQLPEYIEMGCVNIPLDAECLGCSKEQLRNLISSSFWGYANLYLWCIKNQDNSIQAVEVSGGDGIKVTNRIDRLKKAFDEACIKYFEIGEAKAKRLNEVVDVIVSSYVSDAMYNSSLLREFEETKQMLSDNERELNERLECESLIS